MDSVLYKHSYRKQSYHPNLIVCFHLICDVEGTGTCCDFAVSEKDQRPRLLSTWCQSHTRYNHGTASNLHKSAFLLEAKNPGQED